MIEEIENQIAMAVISSTSPYHAAQYTKDP